MPRPKVIDDTKLTELYQQNRTLKSIGDELGVSHVAVHKRIKRLRLSKLPKSLEKLTDKEKGFCMAVVGGQSRISAVMQTYDVTSRESAKAIQKTLMKNPEIRACIEDMMEMKGIGRDFRLTKLSEHMNHPDPVISLKSLDMAFKLSGDAEESKKQQTGFGFDISCRSINLDEITPVNHDKKNESAVEED